MSVQVPAGRVNPAAPQTQLTVTAVIDSMARHRAGVVGTTAAVAALATAVLLLLPPRYEGRTSLIPESRANQVSGGLEGLAALAGVSLTGATGAVGQSPQFYAALLRSRPIMNAVLSRRYATTGLGGRLAGRDSAALVEILRPAGSTEAQRLWNGARVLGALVAVSTDVRTGIITLAVQHRSPQLAAQVARAFTDELERFNREARQTQAGARRRFIESQLVDVARDLEAAEGTLRAFLIRNREYQNSPSLRFEYGRLERAVVVQQELYLNLRRELDAARIAEVDDVPAITVIEQAIVPQRRSWPPRRAWFMAVVAVTLVGAVTAAVVRDHHAHIAPGLVPALSALWRWRATA